MKINLNILLIIVLAGSLSFLTATELGTGGQEQQIPTIDHILDSNILKNDWYAVTTAPFDIRYYFNHLIIGVNYLFPNLSLTLLFLHVLSFILFYVALFFLSRFLLRDEDKALFVTLFLLIAYPLSLGSTSFFKANLSPNGLAWPLIIGSMYFFFKERYFLSFTILGLATLMDTADALLAGGVMIGTIALQKPLFSREKIVHFLQTIPFWAILSLILIPLSQINITSPLLSSLASSVVANQLFKHIEPSSWNLLDIIPFVFLMVLFWVTFKEVDYDKKHRQTIKIFALIVALYGIIGFIFVEIIPIATITKLMVFRATKLITVLAYITIGSYLFTKMSNGKTSLERIYYGSYPLSFLYPILTILFIPLFLLINHFQQKRDLFTSLLRRRKLLMIITGGGIVLFVSIILALKSLLPPARTSLDAVIPYIIVPAGLYLLGLFFLVKKNVHLRILIICLVVGTALIIGPHHSAFNIRTYSLETEDLFHFIRESTPSDSVLLTPPFLHGFRTETKRAIVVDMFYPFTDVDIAQWYLRFKDISNGQIKTVADIRNITLVEQGYHSLDVAQVQHLKEKYGFQYAIFDSDKRLDSKIIFQNRQYVVYSLTD